MYNDIYRLVGERIEDPETFNSILEVNNKALGNYIFDFPSLKNLTFSVVENPNNFR